MVKSIVALNVGHSETVGPDTRKRDSLISVRS